MRACHLTTAAMAALSVLAAAPLAQGAVLTFTYKGHITSSLDNTGEFGAIGANKIVGKAYTAKFFLDLGKPGATNMGSTVYSDFFYGYGLANPMTGVLKLNGRTLTIGGGVLGDYGYDERTDYSLNPSCTMDCQTAIFQQSVSNQTDTFTDDGGDHYIGHFLNGTAMSTDGSLSGLTHGPLNLTNPPIQLTNFIDIYEYVNTPGAGGDFVGQSLTHRTVLADAEVFGKADLVSSGTPEPASWALIIAGFGLAGATLRARRRALP